MKTLILFVLVFIFSGFAKSDDIKKVWTKDEISDISDKFIFNDLKIKNPIIADENGDGYFDILNFEDNGEIKAYYNLGNNENPVFDKNNFKLFKENLSSVIKSIPMPVFFADNDGDTDPDMFVVTDIKYNSSKRSFEKEVKVMENAFDFSHYTLITIILVLIIVILLIKIL
ncbi:MAG TPA: hypothetical protein PLG90_02490 [Ignavibacteria bacterium]|nr:hypothetical protein [Ignavibacteria bacterium]